MDRPPPKAAALHRESLPRGFARGARAIVAGAVAALLAACHTVPPAPAAPGTVSHLPPGNSERDGPEANPPPNLEAVPDAVPQIEPIRVGGPNKPYEIAGHIYVPLTDDRAVTEKGLASWYGKRFHGHRTASGEAYNMYAMTAAHKTLPIPSYARVRNPANGHEVIVRVNDRGPFSAGRVIDLSYTAALKLGLLGGVQQVEISRITEDDIRTGAAFRHGPALAAAAPAAAQDAPQASRDIVPPIALAAARTLPPSRADVVASAAEPSANTVRTAASADPALYGPGGGTANAGRARAITDVDLGAAAATDAQPPVAGSQTTITTVSVPGPAPVASAASGVSGLSSPSGSPPPMPAGIPAGVVLPPLPANQAGAKAPSRSGDGEAPVSNAVQPMMEGAPSTRVAGAHGGVALAAPEATPSGTAAARRVSGEPRDEQAHAETSAGAGYWVQLGAFKQRTGALDFQHKLIDEQPWLAPLLAVFTDHGLNKLQAGPYRSREDARSAAERVRSALQLVPTIVEKR